MSMNTSLSEELRRLAVLDGNLSSHLLCLYAHSYRYYRILKMPAVNT